MNRRPLIRLRQLLGWSQHVVAKRAKIGRSKLSLYENGHIPLEPDEAVRLESTLREGLRSAGQTFAETLERLSGYGDEVEITGRKKT